MCAFCLFVRVVCVCVRVCRKSGLPRQCVVLMLLSSSSLTHSLCVCYVCVVCTWCAVVVYIQCAVVVCVCCALATVIIKFVCVMYVLYVYSVL